MNKELINHFIALSLAITVFNQDKENFNDFKLGNLYQDKLDAIIKKMKKDFYAIKSELTKSNINVRLVDQYNYIINGNGVRYTSDQLKEMTANVMHDYLHSVDFELSDRVWPDVDNTHKR